MNYEEMSDFDINAAVAEFHGVNWWSPPSNSPSGGWEYCKVPELITKQDCKLPGYCNSWADAGTIIFDNKITVFSHNDTHDDSLWMAELDEFHFFNVNPLRAAMIVFLMMKDAEK